MPGRRPSRLVIAASVVTLVAALAATRYVFRTPNHLGPEVSETAMLVHGPVGHRATVVVFGFYPHGPDPVRVRDVRVTGIPEGLRILAVHGTTHVGGTTNGEPDPEKFGLRPVTDMTFEEGKPEQWRLAVVIEGTKPGRWLTTGVDIAWRAGRHKGTTHFKYAVGMEVTS